MFKPSKLVLGIRPPTRMFRMTSRFGELADHVSAKLLESGLTTDYYSEVSLGNAALVMQDDKKNRQLRATIDDFIFTHDYLATGKYPIEEKFIGDFFKIWKLANSVMRMDAVRRIGIYAEFKFSHPRPSKCLIEAIAPTMVKNLAYPAKFVLNFENRIPTNAGKAPNEETDDFVNIIQQFYDGKSDTEHPDNGAVFAVLDVQRYFAPHLTKPIEEETRKLFRRFHESAEVLKAFADSTGLTSVAETKAA